MPDPNVDPLDLSPTYTRALHDATQPVTPAAKRRGILVDPASGDVTTGALADEIGRLRRHQIIALAYADTSRREAAGAHAETLAAIDAVANRVAAVEKQLTDLRALTQRIADALGVINPIGDISVSQVTKNRIGLDDKR